MADQAFSSYAPTAETGPGFLYVNSRISAPDKLSPSLFTKWYNEVHVPDIFQTSGMKSAFRYYSTNPDSAHRPYLALYPLNDVSFLQTDEFKSIPVHHEMLPGPSHAIFDVADFDTRYCKLLKTFEDAETEAGVVKPRPSEYVVIVGFDALEEYQSDPEKLLRSRDLPLIGDGLAARRIRLLKVYFGRQNRNPAESNSLGELPRYLALYEFDSEDFPQMICPDAQTASFKLLRAFGGADVKF